MVVLFADMFVIDIVLCPMLIFGSGAVVYFFVHFLVLHLFRCKIENLELSVSRSCFQVWCLIVSILDLCPLFYFNMFVIVRVCS